MFDDKCIEANQARMESARYGFDSLRGEIADLCLPEQSGFNARYLSQGRTLTNVQYDEYAALSLEDGVSGFEGFVMPRGQKWQKIALGDDKLMESVRVQQWLEAKAAMIFKMRNDPKSGFTSAVHTSAQSLFAFGEQSMWVDKRYDGMGRFIGLSYQSEHVSGIYVENDAEGNPMRIHRKFTLSAEQALLKWKEEAPPKVKEAMAGDNPNSAQTFEFVHCIESNDRMMADRIDAAGMPWKGCYYSGTDKRVFKIGGYRTLRRIVSRWGKANNEDYGRGPAGKVLAAIRATQLMMQDRVLATEMAVKPPLLAMDDDLDQAIIALGPFGITYGGLDEMGREKLKTFLTAIDLNGAKELHDELHGYIDRVFYRDLMQINRELKTHISAARTMEEIGEKGIMLSPMARQEQEWFAPMLDTELDLLWDEGFLDDMPPEIADYFHNGGGVHVIYDNNLSRMQEATAAAGYLRTAEQVASIAQFDPSAVQAFTREYPLSKVIPGLGDVNGIPAKWRATDEEKAAEDEQKQQQVQLETLLKAAPTLSQSVKNVAEAGAVSGG
jgi:hypothetical protein